MNKSVTQNLCILVVTVCSLRFLLDGVSFSGVVIGHVDPLAYGSILTPVLAAHGWIKTKMKVEENKNEK